MPRLLLAPAILLALLTANGTAAAQGGADIAVEVAIGKALLEEGTRLFRDGHAKDALDKLMASVRNDPTPSALLALGACQEQLGTTATAWGTYHRAEERARTLGDAARAGHAAKRAAALDPRLSRVRVVVMAAGTKPRVTLDDRELAAETWGVPLPLDPGAHRLVAREGDKRPFSVKFEVAAEGELKEVIVPELRFSTGSSAPGGSAASPPGWVNEPVAPTGNGQQGWRRARMAGMVMFWTGLSAGVLATIPLGVLAFSSSAKGSTADYLLGSGLGMVTGGIVLGVSGYALATVAGDHVSVSAAPHRVGFRPFVARSGGGFTLQGAF